MICEVKAAFALEILKIHMVRKSCFLKQDYSKLLEKQQTVNISFSCVKGI